MTLKETKKPNPVIGVGLRHSHYSDLLAGEKQNVDFVEIHAENFFAKGGASRAVLSDIISTYALSLHGTSLGLGSTLPVPESILAQFAELVEFTQPMLVSEHLCFNRAKLNDKVLHSGDLLPIPYNEASLANIVSHIQKVQDTIARPILIENLSAYVEASQLVPDLRDSFTEFEFLIAMCERAGCGLLLDLNNLIVNELNRANLASEPTSFSLSNIKSRINSLPKHLVGEIHLAGFSATDPNSFIIDDHGAPVSSQCWELFDMAIQRFSGTPSLVEWDTQMPSWPVLMGEADKARAIANKHLQSPLANSRA
ncbi:DUF692 domain-containing protein [Glaciecola sp. MH2013]|uniref:DUF692 domain-containing protein n=1 Tax=Glaciecola sp. MH2013 TaxID=2785524 RepID=UPI0018A06E82|nr:DUF692 domain-containing protein [Glaciecola sp. MH2013]MBF7072121.1 DUF692 domain-containing protein [Glaciecola sp. MH2013]